MLFTRNFGMYTQGSRRFFFFKQQISEPFLSMSILIPRYYQSLHSVKKVKAFSRLQGCKCHQIFKILVKYHSSFSELSAIEQSINYQHIFPKNDNVYIMLAIEGLHAFSNFSIKLVPPFFTALQGNFGCNPILGDLSLPIQSSSSLLSHTLQVLT